MVGPRVNFGRSGMRDGVGARERSGSIRRSSSLSMPKGPTLACAKWLSSLCSILDI